MPILADLSPEALKRAVKHLSDLDPDWAAHIVRIGPVGHQARPTAEPYETLIRAVAHQQLHPKAGDAITARMIALYPGKAFPTPADLVATKDEALRGCGFSSAKVTTIKGIAQGALDGVVPELKAALVMPDEELIERLVSLRGVGRWTVEMFMIYSLSRSDILAVDDFGIRDGYRRLKKLDVMPTPKELRMLGEAWAPYRTIAAWYLWRMPKDAETALKKVVAKALKGAKAPAKSASKVPKRTGVVAKKVAKKPAPKKASKATKKTAGKSKPAKR
jgi:DNA-3-methyladenine glycosylase II